LNLQREQIAIRIYLLFQSLSRDSGHLNVNSSQGLCTAGTQFQSLSRDSGHLNPFRPAQASPAQRSVSIPQSGFGAFEPGRTAPSGYTGFGFQSLSRDSGRLNLSPGGSRWICFRLFQSLSRDSGRLNRGWRGCTSIRAFSFQSLSRDSGRLNT